jgi:WhiB family redox-sensing transcriptional regulator
MAALEFTPDLVVGRGDSERWRDFAACFGRTDLFFPPRAERPQARARRERHARRLCCSCPVSNQCQQYARSHHEYGFWGGESEEDRHLAGYTVSSPIGIRTRRSAASD